MFSKAQLDYAEQLLGRYTFAINPVTGDLFVSVLTGYPVNLVALTLV